MKNYSFRLFFFFLLQLSGVVFLIVVEYDALERRGSVVGSRRRYSLGVYRLYTHNTFRLRYVECSRCISVQACEPSARIDKIRSSVDPGLKQNREQNINKSVVFVRSIVVNVFINYCGYEEFLTRKSEYNINACEDTCLFRDYFSVRMCTTQQYERLIDAI